MSSKKQPSYAAGLKKTSDSNDKSSVLFWILASITLIFLFWAPFQRGLFNGNSHDFEAPIYSSFVWASIIFILVSIFLYYHWKLQVTADLVTVLIWLIPLTYLISTFGAASHHYAENMLYIQVIYAAFFMTGYYLTRSSMGVRFIQTVVITSSYFIVIFGLMNWLGNKEAAYSMVKWFANEMNQNYYLHAVMSDSNGPRLTSVFQYANTYAGFLIAVLLCGLFYMVRSTRWISTTVHAFMVVPVILSFFVTLSRGGLVLFPFVLLVVLPFLKPSRQVMYLIHMALGFGLSLTILNKVTNIGVELFNQYNSTLSLSGWTNIVIVSLIYTVLTVLLQTFVAPRIEQGMKRFEEKRVSYIALPAAAIVLGSIVGGLLLSGSGITKLLPENIATRIENINLQQHSVLERGTFYKDALKLYSDYPVFGAGGGAWATLYEKYQNNPYVSRQAHNFFLQYLTEVGIFGFVIFIALLAAIFYIYIRNYLKQDTEARSERFVFYIFAAALLIHSALDFDLSFVYLGLLLFLCLGAMNAGDRISIRGTWKDSFSSKLKWVYPSVSLLVSLVLFFNAVSLVSASRGYQQSQALASSGQSTLPDILAPLNESLERSSGHPDFAYMKISLLLQAYNQSKDEKYWTDAEALLKETRAKEPYNFMLIERQLYMDVNKNRNQEALALTMEQLNNFPWKVMLYELAISLNTDLGHTAREAGNAQQQEQHWNEALRVHERFEEKRSHLGTLPKEQIQGNDFSLTPKMIFALGQIHYIRGSYAEAENVLKNSVGGSLDDQTVRQNLRWYLASLAKQGKRDQALQDQLVAKDPNEAQEIQNLVNAKL